VHEERRVKVKRQLRQILLAGWFLESKYDLCEKGASSYSLNQRKQRRVSSLSVENEIRRYLIESNLRRVEVLRDDGSPKSECRRANLLCWCNAGLAPYQSQKVWPD